jgi:hypothetical protein
MLCKILTCTLREHSVEGSGYLFLVFSMHEASEQWSQTPAKDRYRQKVIEYSIVQSILTKTAELVNQNKFQDVAIEYNT